MTRYKDTFVAQGGLMRCCLASIDIYVDLHDNEEVIPGTTVDCVFEDHNNKKIIIDNESTWRWNQPDRP